MPDRKVRGPRVAKLKCPHCGERQSQVKACRVVGEFYRRTRECDTCERRYFTREIVERVAETGHI